MAYNQDMFTQQPPKELSKLEKIIFFPFQILIFIGQMVGYTLLILGLGIPTCLVVYFLVLGLGR